MEEKKEYEKVVEQMKEFDKRDKEMRTKIVKDWRAAYGKDPAGHTLNAVQYLQAEVANLQQQIDTIYPLGVLARTINVIVTTLAGIETRLALLEKAREK